MEAVSARVRPVDPEILKQQLLDEVTQLPVGQDAALRLLVMFDDPSVSTATLGLVVESDPALTVQVLRTANSPFYGLSRRVGSVRQAITVLGFAMVRSLAAAKIFKLGNRDADVIPASYWRHSFTTAAAASVIARTSGAADERRVQRRAAPRHRRRAAAPSRPGPLRRGPAPARARHVPDRRRARGLRARAPRGQRLRARTPAVPRRRGHRRSRSTTSCRRVDRARSAGRCSSPTSSRTRSTARPTRRTPRWRPGSSGWAYDADAATLVDQTRAGLQKVEPLQALIATG